jgi:hypothetical protein
VSVRQRAGVVDYPANQLASLDVAARLRRWVMITDVRAVLEFADPVVATAMWPSRCLSLPALRRSTSISTVQVLSSPSRPPDRCRAAPPHQYPWAALLPLSPGRRTPLRALPDARTTAPTPTPRHGTSRRRTRSRRRRRAAQLGHADWLGLLPDREVRPSPRQALGRRLALCPAVRNTSGMLQIGPEPERRIPPSASSPS